MPASPEMNLSSPCPSAGATACTLSSSRPEPTRHSLGKVSPYPQCKPAPLSDPQCPPHILLTGPRGPLQHSSLFTRKLSTEDKGSLFILCTVLPCPNSVAEFVNTSTNHQKPEDPLVSLVRGALPGSTWAVSADHRRNQQKEAFSPGPISPYC